MELDIIPMYQVKLLLLKQTLFSILSTYYLFYKVIIMANKPTTALPLITSLKDGAYQQAKASDTVKEFARYAFSNIQGFPEDIPKESLEQLNEGYLLRWNDNNPAEKYAVINDHFIKYDAKLHKDCEVKIIGASYVMSFTPQAFGALKESEPYLHELLVPIRKKIQTYCSNRVNDLKREGKKILRESDPASKTRSAIKSFNEIIKDIFDAPKTGLVARCKVAKSQRNDIEADEAKLKLAINAFNKEWNKQ